MIAVREYTSALEMMRAAQATRARIWNARPKANINKRQTQEHDVVVNATQVLPVWEREDTHFDAHVIQSRWILDRIKSGDVDPVWAAKKPVNDIIRECLKRFPEYSLRHITGSSRIRRLTLARQIIVYEVRTQRPDLSYPEIGRRFGGRDHTTILYAVNKIAAMKERGELDWYFGARS